MVKYKEPYWLDEKEPRDLRHRADDLARDGHIALADQLYRRADELQAKSPHREAGA